jgi:hypothetical protein
VSQILTLAHPSSRGSPFGERGQCFENAVASVHVAPHRALTQRSIQKIIDEKFSDKKFAKFVKKKYRLLILTKEETIALIIGQIGLSCTQNALPILSSQRAPRRPR